MILKKMLKNLLSALSNPISCYNDLRIKILLNIIKKIFTMRWIFPLLFLLFLCSPAHADSGSYCRYLVHTNDLLEQLSKVDKICLKNQARFTSTANRTKAMIKATKSFTAEQERLSRLKFNFEYKTEKLLTHEIKPLNRLLLDYINNYIEMNEEVLSLNKQFDAKIGDIEDAQNVLEEYLVKGKTLKEKIMQEKTFLAASYPSGCAMTTSNILKIYIPLLSIFTVTIWWYFIKK